MTTIRIKLPTIKQVEFKITAEQDDIDPRGMFASGSDKQDEETLQAIYDSLEDGNTWAWASVKVECHYKGLTGTDYLGGCSYEDEEDFMRDAYYQDMKNAAYADLIRQIKRL